MNSRLSCGIVVGVREDACEIIAQDGRRSVRFAAMFPAPRTERVSPGHLVAVANAGDGVETVVWRWYDAVLLADDGDLVRLWEPAHGEVSAVPRDALARPVGSRAYLSAGLPGADWWVAGPVVARPADAEVELDEVERFLTDHDLWNQLV